MTKINEKEARHCPFLKKILFGHIPYNKRMFKRHYVSPVVTKLSDDLKVRLMAFRSQASRSTF